MSRADRGYVRPPLTATEPRRPRAAARAARVALTVVVAAVAAVAVALAVTRTGIAGTAEQDPRLRPPAPSPDSGSADGSADR